MGYLELPIINIEIDRDTGEKCVHYYADSYYSDDGTNTPYRFVEYTWAYIPLSEVLKNGLPDGDLLSQVKQYIMDCTEEKISELYEHYDNGNKPVILPYCELTKDMLCGCYIITDLKHMDNE